MRPIEILCYGDSNTWGYCGKDGSRFGRDLRWTGRLAQSLGRQYHISEEGLNGRTSGFMDPIKPYTDGYSYLLPCLLSHSPFDYITVMLGTNDIKTRYQASAQAIADSVKKLIRLMQGTVGNPDTKILLMAPVPVNAAIIADPEYDLGAVEKSQLLVSELQKAAAELSIDFFNVSDYVKALDEDGCHFTKEGHEQLAEALTEKIRSAMRK